MIVAQLRGVKFITDSTNKLMVPDGSRFKEQAEKALKEVAKWLGFKDGEYGGYKGSAVNHYLSALDDEQERIFDRVKKERKSK